MKVLICGSRTWRNRGLISEDPRALDLWLDGQGAGAPTIIHGAAAGADDMADREARAMRLPIERFPADWARYGRVAGPMRNARMLVEGQPDVVVAYRVDGESRGTDDMTRAARAAGVPVIIRTLQDRKPIDWASVAAQMSLGEPQK